MENDMNDTLTQPTLKLTDQQLQQYRDEGYTLGPGLIPATDLEPARRELLALEAGEHDWPEDYFQFPDPAKVRNPKGGKLIGGVQRPAKKSEDFNRIAQHANLQAAMATLLGGPVKLFTNQCGIKSRYITTEQGGMSFFHQDSYYWH